MFITTCFLSWEIKICPWCEVEVLRSSCRSLLHENDTIKTFFDFDKSQFLSRFSSGSKLSVSTELVRNFHQFNHDSSPKVHHFWEMTFDNPRWPWFKDTNHMTFLRDYELNFVCKDLCYADLVDCALICSDDTICLADCARIEAECIEGENFSWEWNRGESRVRSLIPLIYIGIICKWESVTFY